MFMGIRDVGGIEDEIPLKSTSGFKAIRAEYRGHLGLAGDSYGGSEHSIGALGVRRIYVWEGCLSEEAAPRLSEVGRLVQAVGAQTSLRRALPERGSLR